MPNVQYVPRLPPATVQNSPSSTYGVDISWLDDLDPNFSIITGQAVLAQDIYHRLTTRKGTLFYDQSWGENIRDMLNESVLLLPGGLASFQERLRAEVELDDRVLSAVVNLSYNPATQAGTLTVAVTPRNGQFFRFILPISSLTPANLTTRV